MNPQQPDQTVNTTSLDLPPALQSLLNMGSIEAPAMPPSAGLSMTGGAPMSMPSYEEGGMIGPGGMPEPPAASGQTGLAPPSGGLTPQQIQSEAQRFVQNNPRQVQEIQMALQQAMQSGDLTPQELNTLVQMATVALQNPEMYPQLRAMAIQEGLAQPQDISPQFDPGILFTLVVVGQAMQQGGMQPQAQAQAPQPQTGQVMQPGGMPSFKKGGELPTKSEPVPIMAHTGEYVIPYEVVKAKGTEFFDSLVAKYRGGNESA